MNTLVLSPDLVQKEILGEENVIRVLLIEDDEDDYVITRELLAEIVGMKFKLDWISTPEAGLEALSSSQHDVCLMDFRIGSTTGIDLLRRAVGLDIQIPIILLTGQNQREIDVEAMKSGASDFLVKGTINAPMLDRSIRYAIERARVKRQERDVIQMREDFIANVSHQLRTPVTSLKGYLELLAKNQVPEPAVREEFLLRAFEDTKRLSGLVNDLLDTSRWEGGYFQLRLEDTDLSAVVANSIKAVEGIATSKKIPLIQSASQGPISVKADAHSLEQVLTNLLSNAIKFSEPPHPIKVDIEIGNGMVTIRVIDEGPGIPVTELEKVFNKFYQAEGGQKQAGVGSGLGLYIANKIIEAHGGHMGVDSEVGKGSTFSFSLATTNS